MFYITKKSSETGKKFAQVIEKKAKAFEDQKALSEKYGFKQWRGGYWCAFGGMSSCLDFKETPDKKIWGKGAEKGEFYPKKNSKVAKAVWQEFQDVTKVSKGELNACVGRKDQFQAIGFASRNDEFFGFETSKKWGLKVPTDCVEVTETKYDELFRD